MLALPSTLALADQAVVSATSFLITLLIGRFCGPAGLADYRLGFSLVVISLTTLHSLVTLPYTVYAYRVSGRERCELAGAALVFLGALAAVAALATGLFGLSFALRADATALAMVILAVALCLPFLLLREFARRMAFAHLRAFHALGIDGSVASLQLAAIAILVTWSALTPSTAILSVGLGAAIVAVTWMLLHRAEFVVQRSRLPVVGRKYWRFGRWVFGGQILLELKSETLLLWLMYLIIGERATGEFVACATIVLLANPFLLGMGQVLAPQATHAYVDRGNEGLRREVAQMVVLLVSVMAGFCLLIVLGGEQTVARLFGAEYAGHQWTLSLLALSTVASAGSMALASGLWALERSKVNFWANLSAMLVALPLSLLLLATHGIVGAAIALLAGRTVGLVFRVLTFVSLTSSKPHAR